MAATTQGQKANLAKAPCMETVAISCDASGDGSAVLGPFTGYLDSLFFNKDTFAKKSQAAGLNILGLKGSGNVRAFGEVCAAVCLAGELSIIGALCAHEFASAHKNLARGKA